MGKLTRDLAIQPDRLALLECEAQREAAAAAVKRRADLVDRFAKTHADADDLALDVQEKVLPELLTKVRKIIELRERARAGFAVRSSHANAAAESVEGASMSSHAVAAHLAYEFYWISAKPRMGGRAGERAHPSLPRGQMSAPRIAINAGESRALRERVEGGERLRH